MKASLEDAQRSKRSALGGGLFGPDFLARLAVNPETRGFMAQPDFVAMIAVHARYQLRAAAVARTFMACHQLPSARPCCGCTAPGCTVAFGGRGNGVAGIFIVHFRPRSLIPRPDFPIHADHSLCSRQRCVSASCDWLDLERVLLTALACSYARGRTSTATHRT
jgi:hypothetical protein